MMPTDPEGFLVTLIAHDHREINSYFGWEANVKRKRRERTGLCVETRNTSDLYISNGIGNID
jgi:hypothetical protein